MTSLKSHPLRRLGASLCTLLLGITLIAPQASAEERTTVIIFTPALTTTTTTGVVLTVIDSTTSSTSSTRDILFGSKLATTAYMAQNSTALKQSISLGDGESLNDLAHMARIAPHDVDTFKATLRTHRKPLVELLSAPDFGETQAMAMTHIIVEAMRENVTLEQYIPEAS